MYILEVKLSDFYVCRSQKPQIKSS